MTGAPTLKVERRPTWQRVVSLLVGGANRTNLVLSAISGGSAAVVAFLLPKPWAGVAALWAVLLGVQLGIILAVLYIRGLFRDLGLTTSTPNSASAPAPDPTAAPRPFFDRVEAKAARVVSTVQAAALVVALIALVVALLK